MGPAWRSDLIVMVSSSARRLGVPEHGYRTVEADTAEEGIRLAQATPPALVLMDIQLPGMNGTEALHHLRADPRMRAIPVIAVTASAMTQDRQKIMTAGFDGYQAKPIEVTQFVAAVRTAVGRPAERDRT